MNCLESVQRPRIELAPESVSSDGEYAEDMARLVGLTPDPWQRYVMDKWLGRTAGGRFSALRCGLAVPRQQGKNHLLEMVELYKMVELGRRVLHTAHLVPTSRKHFLRMLAYFDNPKQYPALAKRVRIIRSANGQEGIYLTNGGQIEFVSRSKNSGRGFTVDDLVLDEAQELDEDALEALLPTISSAPSGDPQQLWTGTPPGPNARGDVWLRMRTAGAQAADPRLAWLEWSVPAGADPNDRENWYATNPALGRRINLEVLESERATFDDAGFLRERLGQWPSEAGGSKIPMEQWGKCATTTPPKDGKLVYAVDMSPTRGITAIAVARRTDEAIHVEVVQHRSTATGTRWVVEWLAERRNQAKEVLIDATSPAASLVPDLKARRVNVRLTSATDMARACGGLADAVAEGTVTHFDQPVLNEALRNARTRTIGTEAIGWGWSRKSAESDITPLVAVTLARYGAASLKQSMRIVTA